MANVPIEPRPFHLCNPFNMSVGAAPLNNHVQFQPFFLVGRHAQPSYLQSLLLTRHEPEVLPARITHHRAIPLSDDVYVLLPSTKKDDIVDGWVHYPQTEWQRERLEGLARGDLLIDNVEVTVWRGWRKKEVWGRCMMYIRDLVSLNENAEEVMRQMGGPGRGPERRRAEAWEEIVRVCREKVEKKVWAWLWEVKDGEAWDWKEEDGVCDVVWEEDECETQLDRRREKAREED